VCCKSYQAPTVTSGWSDPACGPDPRDSESLRRDLNSSHGSALPSLVKVDSIINTRHWQESSFLAASKRLLKAFFCLLKARSPTSMESLCILPQVFPDS
jgi:hypothetical protein